MATARLNPSTGDGISTSNTAASLLLFICQGVSLSPLVGYIPRLATWGLIPKPLDIQSGGFVVRGAHRAALDTAPSRQITIAREANTPAQRYTFTRGSRMAADHYM